MLRVVSDDQGGDVILAEPGKKIYLSWVVKNDSKLNWPRFPILRNITENQKVLQHIKPSEHTKDLLVKKKLSKNEEFKLHYEFSLPEDMPTGVFILKF
jgi:hypothetical protein